MGPNKLPASKYCFDGLEMEMVDDARFQFISNLIRKIKYYFVREFIFILLSIKSVLSFFLFRI